MKLEQIKLGCCYSNGAFGNKWSVWQVVEIQVPEEVFDDEVEQVRYKILVGENRRKYKILSIDEFASKVKYEVTLIENSWQRVK
jgi:hypothetical protein